MAVFIQAITHVRGLEDGEVAVQVDMGGEEDAFQQTATAGLNTLVLGLETRLDAGLQQMVRMPWATIEAVRFRALLGSVLRWLCPHAM